jgi:predicted nucleic-acid-binding protein
VIGLGADIVVRFLVQDDPKQAAAAQSLIARCSAREPAFIGRETLIETVWILEGAYGFSHAAIASAVMGLLEAEEIVVESAEDAVVAAEAYAAGMADFAAHMTVEAARRAGCETLYTFDRMTARHNAATILVR